MLKIQIIRKIIIFTLALFQCAADTLDTDFDTFNKYRQFLLERHSAYCQLELNEAVKELNFKLPIVVRFQGTNSNEGRDIINKD